VFRENDWVDDIGGARTTITVVVRQPRVEHKVQLQHFEQWLEGHPRSPAEMTLKNRCGKSWEGQTVKRNGPSR
jgi:hypothetical protein